MDLKGFSALLPIVVVLAIIMTLQSTVIFTVVIVVACKFSKKRVTATTSAVNDAFVIEERLYDSVNVEHPANKRENELQIHRNSSYGLHSN